MPLLKRLFWPLLAVPCAVAAALVYAGNRAGARPVWLIGALALPVLFGALYVALWRAYEVWSQPPPVGLLEGALVSPEPVLLVSRGGYLTPGSAFFTQQQLVLFAAGRRIVTLPLEHVAAVRLYYGKVLRTPYLDFVAADGRRLGRLAVENATSWAAALRPLCVGGRR